MEPFGSLQNALVGASGRILASSLSIGVPEPAVRGQHRGMSNFVPFNRYQSFLLPPDLKEWLPADDVAQFVVAAVERVPLGAFQVAARAGGKPQ
jgi:hypothetical protein